jgi:hypothetical protein
MELVGRLVNRRCSALTEPFQALRLLISGLRSPDEVVRAKAVGSLCLVTMVGKCSERQANIVSHLTKDSPAVRVSALHVFEDAIHMQSIGDAEYRFQSVEDTLRKKHAPLLRNEERRVFPATLREG